MMSSRLTYCFLRYSVLELLIFLSSPFFWGGTGLSYAMVMLVCECTLENFVWCCLILIKYIQLIFFNSNNKTKQIRKIINYEKMGEIEKKKKHSSFIELLF